MENRLFFNQKDNSFRNIIFEISSKNWQRFYLPYSNNFKSLVWWNRFSEDFDSVLLAKSVIMAAKNRIYDNGCQLESTLESQPATRL